MSVTIEKLQEEDKPQVMALLEQANMHYIPSPEMPSISWGNYFVARLDGQVVGFAGYKMLSATEAKTELIVVDKSCRGTGLGIILQTRRMEEMVAHGAQSLITNCDRPEIIEWYKEYFGYQEIGRLKKEHEFGDSSIDSWTTLRVDLRQWAADRE